MINQKKKILTYHIHGSYLYYLSQINAEFFIPIKEGEAGYARLPDSFDWGDNIHEVPFDKVKDLNLDLIIFQSNWPSNKIFLKDQFTLFSAKQRNLPKIYIEHDPPRNHPTDTKHIVNDPSILLVHVTDFNNLMWDSNTTATTVIDHGVKIPDGVDYVGDKARGIVVVNNIQKRGRRLGLDVFERLRKEVPLDIVGINAQDVGGIESLPQRELSEFISHYRFFFNPIRYTSLGLSICEAMMIGLPVVGVATTELVSVVQNGVNGFIATDPLKLVPFMNRLLKDREYAQKLSENARSYAQNRFGIERFIKDWEEVISYQINNTLPTSHLTLKKSLPPLTKMSKHLND